uniref:AlNc14C86G5508 protein n=1 Tax=Albugo laibachii Nc14 TaxID=890382 RepID=F0WFX4_9STRA|nr:AlNc14C86G5508 [Albugo laibachii Nc14]|eukprot:CCA20108.1 AlNc14C86G5508 [Albugo laibachii Nc14]
MDRRSHIFDGRTYHTGWKLNAKTLNGWIDDKYFYVLAAARASLDPQAFIQKNPGIYILKYNEALFDASLHMEDRTHLAHIKTEDWTLCDQIPVLKLGSKAIRVPGTLYEELERILLKQNFELKTGLFEAQCTKFLQYANEIRSNQGLQRAQDPKPQNSPVLRFLQIYLTETQILQNEDKEGAMCTLRPIEKSEDNRWVVGSSFLQEYSILIKSKGNTVRIHPISRADQG